jgi:hypothetical protein
MTKHLTYLGMIEGCKNQFDFFHQNKSKSQGLTFDILVLASVDHFHMYWYKNSKMTTEKNQSQLKHQRKDKVW